MKKLFLLLVWGLLAAECAAQPALLWVQVSNDVLTVTWTNLNEFRLVESADQVNWVPSTRPFSFVGSRNRRPILFTSPQAFFRLAGADGPAPRLTWELDFNEPALSWPYPSSGFELQSRGELNAAWAPVPGLPAVVGGYKQFEIQVSEETNYFRLSRPLNHVLIVGQSLSVGARGVPILSSNQPFQNKMFIGQQLDGNLPGLPPDDLSDLIPLVERSNPIEQTGETIASGFANSLSLRAGVGEHDLLVSNCGRGGAVYDLLQRGTSPYARGTNQIAAAKALASGLGYQFQAVFAVHGEGDSITPDYDVRIRQWQADYASDVRLLTGQLSDPPMFHSQMSAWGDLHANFTLSPFLTLAESEANPAKTVLVGPKYFLPYSDGLHLTAEGYRWLGEYYAKAYYHQVVQGIPWSPLRPIDITRSNEFITVTFTGNVGDIVLDTNRVSDPRGTIYSTIFGLSVLVTVDPERDEVILPGAHQFQPGDSVYFHDDTGVGGLDPERQLYYVLSTPQSNTMVLGTTTNGPIVDFTDMATAFSMYLPIWVPIGPYGFEYMDDDFTGIPARVSTTIESVEILPPAQVRLRLSKIPTGSQKRLRYAYTAELSEHGGFGGPLHGPRGCLRDSDPTPSLYGNPLYNWCIHFDKPVP